MGESTAQESKREEGRGITSQSRPMGVHVVGMADKIHSKEKALTLDRRSELMTLLDLVLPSRKMLDRLLAT